MCMFPIAAKPDRLSPLPPNDGPIPGRRSSRASDPLLGAKPQSRPGLERRSKQADGGTTPPRPNFHGGAPLNDAPLSEWNLHPIVDFGVIRQLDGQGDGAFGAQRDEGKRRHGGIDIAVPPGTLVRAPAEGTVSTFDPYEDDPTRAGMVDGVQITTWDGRILKVIYVEPIDGVVRAGFVRAGQPIGKSQTLQQVHPPKDVGPITDHVHFEVERKPRIDPKLPFLADPTEIVPSGSIRRNSRVMARKSPPQLFLAQSY